MYMQDIDLKFSKFQLVVNDCSDCLFNVLASFYLYNHVCMFTRQDTSLMVKNKTHQKRCPLANRSIELNDSISVVLHSYSSTEEIETKIPINRKEFSGFMEKE